MKAQSRSSLHQLRQPSNWFAVLVVAVLLFTTGWGEQMRVELVRDVNLILHGAPPPARIGEPVRGTNWQITVTRIDRQKTIGGSSARGEWLIVYVSLVNVGSRNYGISSFDFHLFDRVNNVTYSADSGMSMRVSTTGGLTALFALDNDPPGVELRSALVFDINPAASQLQLVLNNVDGKLVNLN